MILILFILAVAVVFVIWRIFGSAAGRVRDGSLTDSSSINPIMDHDHEWLHGGDATGHAWYGDNTASSLPPDWTVPDGGNAADAGSSWDAGSGLDGGGGGDAFTPDAGGGGDFGGGGAGGDFS